MRLATEDKLFDSDSTLMELVMSLSTEKPACKLPLTEFVRVWIWSGLIFWGKLRVKS